MASNDSQNTGKRSNSRKTDLRVKQRKQERNRTLWIILAIGAAAAVIAGVVIFINFRDANAPIGDIVIPTGFNRPQQQANSVGDPNAPVKLVEVADFQCPACKSFSDNIEQTLLDNYVATGKVYFTYQTFSFLDEQSNGRESKAAAEAAYCAGDQNRYWDYHDILYANLTGENIGNFSDRRLLAFAEKIGLDMTEFKQCFSSGKYTQKVLDERNAAPGLGINSTPTFLINGEIVQITQTWQELFDALDAAYNAAN